MSAAAAPRRTRRPTPEDAAVVFKALGHPERLRVVRALAKGPRSVNELHTACPSDLSTLSKHLAVLRRAGVLTAERRGREILHSLRLVCAADFLECLLRPSSGCVANAASCAA